MFKENKYSKWYHQLIERAIARGKLAGEYYEVHHITPKSMGGGDNADNLVALLAKEHFVAHHLLTKMCISEAHCYAMWNAFFLMHMHSTDRRYYRARTYAVAKLKMSEGKKLKTGKANHFFGKKHTEETRAKMREKRKGRVTCRRDPTAYDFYHETHGIVHCTRYDLCQRFDVCHKSIHSIATGYTTTHRGWRCLNPEPPKTPRKQS